MNQPQAEELQPRSHEARLFPHRLTDLRCASAEAVQGWKNGESRGVPGGHGGCVAHPELPARATNFCLEAQRGWCQARRCSGRCMRTEDEMRYLAGRDLANEGEEAA